VDILEEKERFEYDSPKGKFVFKLLSPAKRLKATAALRDKVKECGYQSVEDLKRDDADLALELEIASILDAAAVEKPDGFSFLDNADSALFLDIYERWVKFTNSFREEVQSSS